MKRHPIRQLADEHRYILKVVRVLEKLGAEILTVKALDETLFRGIIQFMREYADAFHHAKEEDVLFPALIEAGVPEKGCPIGGLLSEHILGRGLVSQLVVGVDIYSTDPERGLRIVKKAIDGMVTLYPDHIWREDEMVFPLVERLVDEGRLADMVASFDAVENDQAEYHQRFEQFAEFLCDKG